MINLPLQFKYTINPLLLIALSFIVFFFVDVASLDYNHQLIKQGEVWRLLTGNFFHTNFNHLLLNCAGVVLIWLLHAEHYSHKSYVVVLTMCCIGCGIGLFLFSQLGHYVGLSGALHGVIAFGALKDIQSKDNTGWLLLIGIIVKVGYENIVGPSESVKAMIESNVAVEAHLYGLVCGILIALIGLMRQRKRQTSEKL